MAATIRPDAQVICDSQGVHGVGVTFDDGAHRRPDSHTATGAVVPLDPDAHPTSECHSSRGVGVTFDDGAQAGVDSHGCRGAVVPLDPDAQITTDSQIEIGVGVTFGPPVEPTSRSTAIKLAADGWLHLRVLADTYDDAMRARIAMLNRVQRASIESLPMGQFLEGLGQTENQLRLATVRQFRETAPEVRAWVKDTCGLGEQLMARLLGAIGDPLNAQPYYWDTEAPEHHACGPTCGAGRHLIALPSFQRTPRQLLSYCGWGDATRRRTKGMSASDAAALGNQRAKPIVYCLAEACMKQIGSQPERGATAEQAAAGSPLTTDDGPAACATAKALSARRRSPYRDVYDLGRARYAERPDWTPGHQHSAALRLVAKAILIDLWRVSAGLEPKWPQQ